jgi:cytochrome c
MMIRATYFAGIAFLAAAAVVADADHPSQVWDGVYTEAQARRGGILYLDHCAECHADDLSGKSAYNASPSLAGADFRSRWDGKTLDELFALIRTRMPKRREGVLKPEEYVDLLAFILQANRFPESSAELSAHAEALGRVRFLKERPR